MSSCAPTRHVSHQGSDAAADACAVSAFLALSTSGGMDTAQLDNALEFEALSREISTRIHEFDRRIRALSTAMREDEATEVNHSRGSRGTGTEETEWQIPSYPASVEREALRGHRSVSSGVDSDPDGLLFLTAFRGAAIHDAVHALEGGGRVLAGGGRERESLLEDLDCEGDMPHVISSRASLLMQSPLPFGGPETRAESADPAWGAGGLELGGTGDAISDLQRSISMAHDGNKVADSLAMTQAISSQASYAFWRPLPLAPHSTAGQRGVLSPVGSPCVSRCEARVASPRDEEEEEEEGFFKAKSDDEGGEMGEDDKDGDWDMPFAMPFASDLAQTSDLTWLSLATSTLDSIWNERQA
jgi:hypothetical protein